MAARLAPFYEPKTEEGRRGQAEVKLQKAREAERRGLEAERRARAIRATSRPIPAATTKETVVPDVVTELYSPSGEDGAYLRVTRSMDSVPEIIVADDPYDLLNPEDD
jgi:hypothetical protein